MGIIKYNLSTNTTYFVLRDTIENGVLGELVIQSEPSIDISKLR